MICIHLPASSNGEWRWRYIARLAQLLPRCQTCTIITIEYVKLCDDRSAQLVVLPLLSIGRPFRSLGQTIKSALDWFRVVEREMRETLEETSDVIVLMLRLVALSLLKKDMVTIPETNAMSN